MSTAMVSIVLAVLALPSATTATVTMARRNCSDTCGGIENDIPYPFGVGPSCSLPGFSLTCAADKHTNNSYLVLGMGNSTLEVLVAMVDPPFVFASISYFVRMIPGVRESSIYWEAPGRPFVLSGSSNTSLYIFGCGVTASMFNSAVEVGSCSAICAQAQIMEKLPEGKCDGIGCCFIDIRVNLRAFTLNITRISDSAHSNMVYASISSSEYLMNFKPIDALRPSMLPSLVPSSATLEWSIPYQRCAAWRTRQAMHALVSTASARIHGSVDTFAIAYGETVGMPTSLTAAQNTNRFHRLSLRQVSNYVTINWCLWFNYGIIFNSPSTVYGSIQPRTDCPTSCGNVSIPFPFGTKLGCFANLHLYLACMPGTVLPVLELTGRMVVSDISLDDGVLHIREESEPNNFFSGSDSDPALYSLSGKWGVVKWAVDKMTCEHEKLDKSDYRCLSSHSECVDVTDDGTLKHLGYRCKCSSGFEGNPYIKDGCTDTNECLQPDKYICNGICHNKFGSYTCTSTVILGVSIGLGSGGGILFLAAIVAIVTRRWKRSVEKRMRKRHFHKNRGILLQQLISVKIDGSVSTVIHDSPHIIY